MKTSDVPNNQDPTVCSCRYSQSPVWVRSVYCVLEIGSVLNSE